MAAPASTDPLVTIAQACATGAQTLHDLQRACGCGERRLRDHLRELERLAPDRLSHQTCDRRLHYRWTGPLPLRTDPWIDEHTLAALVLARGLLHNAGDTTDSFAGPLDGAIDRLLTDCDLAQQIVHISPDTVQERRFAACPECPQTLTVLLDALLHQRHLRFDYTNLRGNRGPVHTAPLRLVLIAGEWHLIAWTGDVPPGSDHLRQYRLARITHARTSAEAPVGRPDHLSASIVDDKLAEAFGATGDRDPRARQRVVLAISPQAWPHLRDRTWGGNQHWDHTPADLPPGWHRLAFVTSGLPEARFRILGFGATVIAEQPPELVTWLREQARQILEQTKPANAATRQSAAIQVPAGGEA